MLLELLRLNRLDANLKGREMALNAMCVKVDHKAEDFCRFWWLVTIHLVI